MAHCGILDDKKELGGLKFKGGRPFTT